MLYDSFPVVVLVYYWVIVLALAAVMLQVMKQRIRWRGSKALMQQHEESRAKILAALHPKESSMTLETLVSSYSLMPNYPILSTNMDVPAAIEVTVDHVSVVLKRHRSRHAGIFNLTSRSPSKDALAGVPASSPRSLSRRSSVSATSDGENIAGSSDSRTILRNVSAKFPAGQLSAILGASGAGKSALLNVITSSGADSSSGRYAISGQVLFSDAWKDAPLSSSGRALAVNPLGKVSYVQQDTSHLLPFLTVRETLRYAARITLPATLSNASKHRLADEVLRKLNLDHCANTQVGNEWVRGISGGERRRLIIATGLLTNPSVLVLDEPT